MNLNSAETTQATQAEAEDDPPATVIAAARIGVSPSGMAATGVPAPGMTTPGVAPTAVTGCEGWYC